MGTHPLGVALKGDTPAPPFDGGGVHAQEERRVGGQAPGQQFGAAGRDVDDEVVVGVGEDFHVELLLQAGGEAFPAVHLDAVVSLVC